MSIYKILFETPENKWKTGLVGMVFITILLAGVFNFEAGATSVISEEELAKIAIGFQTGVTEDLVQFIDTRSETGHTQENSYIEIPFTIEKLMLVEVSCNLNWQDEDSQYLRGTNEPDRDRHRSSSTAPRPERLYCPETKAGKSA